MSLIRTSVASAIETTIKLSSGLLVVKFLSIRAGPEGLATFGQFQNVVAAAIAFCCGAFTTGLVKYIAEARGSEERSSLHVQNAVGVGLVLCLVLGAALLIFAELLSNLVFGQTDYAWAYRVLAVALIPVAVFQIALAVLNGRSEMLRLIVGKSASSLLLLTLSIALVWSMGLDGGLLSVVLAPATALLVAIFLLRGVPGLNVTWFFPKVTWTGFASFWPFWIMSATTVISTPIVLIFIRSYIGENFSWRDAGLWEASWKISELYLLVITTALAVYYVPHVSAAASRALERTLVHKVVLFAVSTSAAMALFIFVFRDLLIRLLFSDDFLPSTELLGPQLAASVIKVGCWVISYHIIVKKRVMTFIASELLFGVVFYFSTWVMLDNYGLLGASYAYLLTMLVYAMFCCWYYTREIAGSGSSIASVDL